MTTINVNKDFPATLDTGKPVASEATELVIGSHIEVEGSTLSIDGLRKVHDEAFKRATPRTETSGTLTHPDDETFVIEVGYDNQQPYIGLGAIVYELGEESVSLFALSASNRLLVSSEVEEFERAEVGRVVSQAV